MFQIKYGIVSEVKSGYIRAKFEEDDGIVSDWLPVVVRKSKSEKESWQLEINEHVVCLMDKFCEEGVCLGAIPSEEDTPDPGEGAGKFRKKFSDDTVIEYDVATHELTVDVKGKLTAKTEGDCKIDSGAKLEAISTGDAKIQAGANIEATAVVKATVTAPNVEITGIVKITGATQIIGVLTCAGISVSAGPGGPGNLDIVGNMNVTGDVEASGSVKSGAIDLALHTHTGVQPGAGSTGPAV